MSDDVEALADSICGCFSNVSDLPEWMQIAALGQYMRPLTVIAAEAVLASDWLAARVQAARAEALEEAADEVLEPRAARWLRARAAAHRADAGGEGL